MCGSESNHDTPVKEIIPYNKRRCTDVLFLLLFIAFWGFTAFFLYKAKVDGAEYWKVIRGTDTRGRICGIDDGVKDKPFAAWPYYPVYDALVCVKSCAETETDPEQVLRSIGETFPIAYYCVPSPGQVNATLSVEFSVGDWNSDMINHYLADLYTARWAIVASVAVAVGLSFAYVYFVKRFAGCLVWTCILGTLAGGILLSYFLLNQAKESQLPEDDYSRKGMRILGYISVAVTAIFLIVVFFLRNSIRLAVAVVKESSKVMDDVKMLIVWPVVPFALAMSYVVFWVATSLFIYSTGSLVDEGILPESVTVRADGSHTALFGTPWKILQFDENYHRVIWVHLFGMFWNLQFVIYFGYIVIAGAVADWYFSTQGQRSSWARTPVVGAVCRTLRFHLGSLAFGALVIAIIKFIRAVLLFLQKNLMSKQPNCLQKAVICCVHCLLRCLECCLDKLSKNGFVYIAIWGSDFCGGSLSAFNLIWRNLLRVAAINMVGDYLLLLGKFTVAGVNTGIFVVVFGKYSYFAKTLSSVVLPSIFVFFLSYLTGSMFMLVFETIIDSTFLCFLVDFEHNHGGNMMASKGLQRLVDDHSKASEIEGESKRARRAAYKGPDDQYARLD